MQKDYLEFAKNISQKAGAKLYENFRKGEPSLRGLSKEVKSIYDEVADEIIINGLKENYPEHSYLTEETGFVDKSSEFLWIIDPLDGTGNFENHNPFFAVSIALFKGKEPLLGVVESPALKERFWAISNEGAFREDLKSGKIIKMKVSDISEKERAYVIFCEGGEKDKKAIYDIISFFHFSSKEIRKIGAASLEIAWVASSRADAYITPKIPIWDIAAGLILAKEAGARLYVEKEELDFKKLDPFSPINLFISNGKLKFNLE